MKKLMQHKQNIESENLTKKVYWVVAFCRVLTSKSSYQLDNLICDLIDSKSDKYTHIPANAHWPRIIREAARYIKPWITINGIITANTNR